MESVGRPMAVVSEQISAQAVERSSSFVAMKKLLFLGACLVALASQPVMAQTSGADVIVVRLIDGGIASQLIIVRGPGKNERIDLVSSTNTKGLISSGEVIQQAIEKLYQEGYSLKSTFSGYGGYGSTLIFVKEK